MELKGVLFEDFVNYKEPSMFLIFPHCSFKCGKELCQNSDTALLPSISTTPSSLISKYLSNPITSAVVCGGLEPFDSFDDLYSFIKELRYHCGDTVVIYTGYEKGEIDKEINELKPFGNIIVKFGRYVPNKTPYYNHLLGVNLVSGNQYAEKIC